MPILGESNLNMDIKIEDDLATTSCDSPTKTSKDYDRFTQNGYNSLIN